MNKFKTYAEYDRGIHESILGDYMRVEDHEKIVKRLEKLLKDSQRATQYWKNRYIYE